MVAGAALAWSVRITIDAILLAIASVSLLPETRKSLWQAGGTLLGSGVVLLVGSLIPDFSARVVFVAVVLFFPDGVVGTLQKLLRGSLRLSREGSPLTAHPDEARRAEEAKPQVEVPHRQAR